MHLPAIKNASASAFCNTLPEAEKFFHGSTLISHSTEHAPRAALLPITGHTGHGYSGTAAPFPMPTGNAERHRFPSQLHFVPAQGIVPPTQCSLCALPLELLSLLRCYITTIICDFRGFVNGFFENTTAVTGAASQAAQHRRLSFLRHRSATPSVQWQQHPAARSSV